MNETMSLLRLIGYDTNMYSNKITGKGVEGMMVNNHVYVDKKRFFDKPSKSEIRLPTPKSIRQFIFLAEKMKELSMSKDNEENFITEYPIK